MLKLVKWVRSLDPMPKKPNRSLAFERGYNDVHLGGDRENPYPVGNSNHNEYLRGKLAGIADIEYVFSKEIGPCAEKVGASM